MNNTVNLPTPADKIVADLVNKIGSIKPEFVYGVYLIGSITMDDFYSNKSDIDFLVLCKGLPDNKTAIKLKHIHKAIEKHFYKPNLSGSYLAFNSIQVDKPENVKALSYNSGSICYANLDMAPVSLMELKSNAFTVFGPKAETLPVTIKQRHINDFLYNNINSYWTKWVNRHSSLFNRKILLLLLPRLTEWAVLGVARQLCTLQTEKIVSNTVFK